MWFVFYSINSPNLARVHPVYKVSRLPNSQWLLLLLLLPPVLNGLRPGIQAYKIEKLIENCMSYTPHMICSTGIEMVFENIRTSSGGIAFALSMPMMLVNTCLVICKISGTASMVTLQQLDAISWCLIARPTTILFWTRY